MCPCPPPPRTTKPQLGIRDGATHWQEPHATPPIYVGGGGTLGFHGSLVWA